MSQPEDSLRYLAEQQEGIERYWALRENTPDIEETYVHSVTAKSGKVYEIRVDSLGAFSETIAVYPPTEPAVAFHQVNDTLRVVQANQARADSHNRYASGMLLEIEELPEVTVLHYVMARSTLPMHQLLVGRAYEVFGDEAFRAANGLRALGSNGSQIRVLTAHEVGRDEFMAHATEWPANQYASRLVETRLAEVAEVSSQVLPAVAQRIAENPRLGGAFTVQVTKLGVTTAAVLKR